MISRPVPVTDPVQRPVPVSDPNHRPAPVTHGPDDVALVFESGGMRGAYTAGLVRVMLEAGLSFPWVGGISAGCTNTCNFVFPGHLAHPRGLPGTDHRPPGRRLG